jgi:hypothetical protein
VSAPTTTEDLAEQIRELFAQAEAAGQPLPGRPTLTKLTGASEHRVRVALEQLAKTSAEADRDASGQADEGGDADLLQAELPGETASNPGIGDRQESTNTMRLVDERAAEEPDTVGSVRPPEAVHADSALTGDQRTASAPGPASATVAPAGAKIVSWAGFVFGSVMSVAANVLHTWLPAARMPSGWTPGIAAQVGAAVWPIALLLSVEVLSRVPWRRGRLWSLVRFGGAGTVALGSAVISYGHVQDVLAAWGYSTLAAHVGPLALDGLMVISGFALLTMSSSPITAADQAR